MGSFSKIGESTAKKSFTTAPVVTDTLSKLNAVENMQNRGSASAWFTKVEAPKLTPNEYDSEVSRLQQIRQQAAVDLNTDVVNDIDKRLKALREQQGLTTFADRANDVTTAISAGVFGSAANTLGLGANMFNDPAQYQREINRLQTALDTGKTTDGMVLNEAQRKTVEASIEDLQRKKKQAESKDSLHNKIYSVADRATEDSATAHLRAKQDLGKVGSTIVDAGVAFGQSAVAGVLGGVTGTGLAPFMVQAFGSAAQDARKNGGDLSDQLLLGSTQAAKEYITEKLFGIAVPQKLAGATGSFDNWIKKRIQNVAGRLEKPGAEMALGGLLTWLAGGATEALEEGIGALIEETIINPNFKGYETDDRTTQEKFEEALYNVLIGGVSGLMGVTNLLDYTPGTVSTSTGKPQIVNATRPVEQATVSPAASHEVQQVQAQAEVTQAQNPEAEVLDAATTLFTQQGMNLKTAQTRAEIVGKLVRGEEVSDKDLNKIDPTSNQTKQIFTQLTGVQFPEGKIQIEALRNLYRSAHTVAQAAEAQVATVAENARVESQITDEQILERAKEARAKTTPESDKKAAQMLAQARGEIAPDGTALLSYKDFAARYMELFPEASRQDAARAYDDFIRDNQTISFMGRRMTRQQVLNTLNTAPGVERLTAEERAQVEADLNEKFDRELEAQKKDGKDATEHSERRRRTEVREKVQRSVNDWKKVLIKNSSVKDIVLDESLGENEAAFITPDGVIHLNAKRMTSEADVAYVLGHELVHSIDDSTARKTMVNDIIDTVRKITEPTESREDAIERYRKMYQEHENQVAARANREAKTISFEYAEEEYAADLMREVFLSGDMLNKLAAEKPSLMARIQEILQKWIASLKGNNEAVELYNELTALQDRFVKALQTDAAQQKLALENAGIEVDTETESARHDRYSLDTWLESDYMTDPENAAKALAKAIGVSDKKAAKYIKDVNGVAKLIADDKTLLDYNAAPGVSSFVSNTEYGGSVDFSTICKKRRLFTGTFTAIQKALPNKALTSDEMIDIRKRMKDAGHEVSCGLCYVEGSRLNLGQYATEFLDKYTAEDHEFVPAIADLTTVEGQENLRLEHPDVYEAYIKYLNSLAQRKPKVYQTATAYNGEILKKFGKDTKVEEKNKNGGLRLQSFSDFEIIHLIDNMQVIMDMSRVGLAGQAYTKVPDFAWAMGNTGLKINLSLIAKDVDADGHLVFDDVEGMPHEEAKKLRDAYSDNVGTIIVVFNDAQLKAAMADDFIDYIIPFHRSQLNQKQYDGLGLPKGTKNYTLVQNESYIEPVLNKNGKKTRPDNYMPNTYWDFNKSGKENAEAYLKMCAENNRRPKFSNVLEYNGDGSYSLPADGSADGYWKLLIDFKMYNNDGVGVPQQPVKPDFNIDEANRMLSEYKGGHSNFPVAQDIVDAFVADYKKNHPDARYSIAYEGASDPALQKSLASAKRRILNGDSASDVRADTGWWRNKKDGLWRYEIDDKAMSWEIPDVSKVDPANGIQMPDLLKHEALFAAYPHLQNYTVKFDLDPSKSGGEGSHDGPNLTIHLERDADLNNPEVKKAIAHELQHAVQYFELNLGHAIQAGFSPRGGYRMGFVKAYRSLAGRPLFDALPYAQKANLVEAVMAKTGRKISGDMLQQADDAVKSYADHYYTTALGEVEAETVANRVNMSAAERLLQEISDDALTGHFESIEHSVKDFKRILKKMGWNGLAKNLPPIYNRLVKDGELRATGSGVQSEAGVRTSGQDDATRKIETESRGLEVQTVKSVSSEYQDLKASEKSGAFNLDDYDIEDLLKLSDADFQKLYEKLGLDQTIDDDILLEDDFDFEDIAEELDEEPEKIEILFRRAGLGGTHVVEGREAVMTTKRIDDRIKEHSAGTNPDYARRYITRISPKDFIEMTVHERNVDRETFDTKVTGDVGSTMGDWDYNTQLIESREPPVLDVDLNTGKIIGHNGRHRVRALEMAGIESVEIEVEFYEDGYLKKYGAKTIPDVAISSQFDTKIETYLSNVIPMNRAHRDEILASYGEEAHTDAAVKYSITPQFEQWYKETYGEDVSTAHLKRRLKTAERRAAEAEHDKKAAELKNTIDSEMDLTAWMIHHTKKMREQKRVMNTKLDEARKAKAEAVRTAVSETKVVERAKAEVQHDADRMAERRNAAKRLRVREDAYKQKVTEMKENQKLKRNAAKATLRDSKLAAKRRAEIEAEQGVVDTIRKNPAERAALEKELSLAEKLRVWGRDKYAKFVSQAASIERFGKRQTEGIRADTLVNIAGASLSTVETTFKNGLVDRAGNRIGDSMSDVFLCWDEKHKKVNEGQQALLQDFMLHWHNIDRMSIVARAESALETFELNHEWLRDMDPKEFARLTAMTEKELEKNGQYEAQQLAFQYHKLLRDYTEAANKPIFADDKGNSVTAETSQRIVDQYLEEHPWLLEKANGIYEWWDRFMREWAVGDTISEAEYERMHTMYPHYVPTYRADKNGVGGANFVGAGGANVSKAVKKAKGSHSEVMNIEDSFSNIVSKIIRLNRVNELYMNIIDTAMLDNDGLFSDMAYFDWDSSWQSGEYGEALLDGELTETVDDAVTAGLEDLGDGEFKLTGWLDGRKYTAFISKDLYKSIGNVTGYLESENEKLFIKAGNMLTGPMKSMITGYNPFFAIRNLVRDYSTGCINSISGLAFPKYYARAWKEMAKGTDRWQTFKALGGTHATYYNNNSGFGDAMSQTDGVIGKTKNALGFVNNNTESATRFAEYLATIDRLGDTYENRLKGIKNSAEVTVDFSRKGSLGKGINAWVSYWNPAVQGIDKTIRSLIDSPDGSAIWKQASRTLGRAAMSTVLWEAVQYALLAYLDRDDEWEELDDRTKDTYYCIPLRKSKTFLKVPKNREWGAILGASFSRMLQWAGGREDPFENYIETCLEPNFLPPALLRLDEDGGLTSDIIGVSQALDLQSNKDFAGRTIVPYAYQQGTKKNAYDADTSVFSIALGQLIGKYLSPMQIDYIISDYCGDFGDLFILATAKSSWAGEGNAAEKLLKMVRNPFIADARYSNYDVNSYYELTEELGKVVQDKKNQLGNEKYKETIEYQTQKALDIMYGDQISELNRYVRDLPDGDEKDAVKEQIAQLAKDAIEFYEDSMAGKVNNPIRTAEYHDFSETVSKELIRMDAFSGDYKFTPTGNPSSKYTDPNDKNREYILTDEQKDYFKQLYREKYNEIFEDLIQSSKYKKKKDSEKAELLEDARDDVLDATKEEFFEWLDDTGVRSTKKQK